MPDSCRCLHARAPPPSFTIAIQACASSNNTDQVLLKDDARHNARRAGAESWPAPPPFCLAVATQSSQAAHRTASMHTRVYLSDNATSIFLSRHSKLYGFLPPLSFPCMHNLRFHLQRGTEAHQPATTYAIFFRTPEKTKGNAVNNASNGSTLVLNRGAQPSKTCSIGQSNYKPIYF